MQQVQESELFKLKPFLEITSAHSVDFDNLLLEGRLVQKALSEWDGGSKACTLPWQELVPRLKESTIHLKYHKQDMLKHYRDWLWSAVTAAVMPRGHELLQAVTHVTSAWEWTGDWEDFAEKLSLAATFSLVPDSEVNQLKKQIEQALVCPYQKKLQQTEESIDALHLNCWGVSQEGPQKTKKQENINTRRQEKNEKKENILFFCCSCFQFPGNFTGAFP